MQVRQRLALIGAFLQAKLRRFLDSVAETQLVVGIAAFEIAPCIGRGLRRWSIESKLPQALGV